MKVKDLFESGSFKEGFMSSLFKSGAAQQSKPSGAYDESRDDPGIPKYHVVSKLDGFVMSSHRTEAEAKSAAHGNDVQYGDIEVKNGVKYVKPGAADDGKYNDAGFIAKAKELEKMRADAKQHGDRQKFDFYNAEIEKLHGVKSRPSADNTWKD